MPIPETQIYRQMDIEAYKAIDSLSRYKFLMFGYHSANWVNLNKLLTKKKPNPFGPLVKMARTGLESATGNIAIAGKGL